MASRNKREGVYAGMDYQHRRGHAEGYHAPSSANARAVSVIKGNRWLASRGYPKTPISELVPLAVIELEFPISKDV